MGLEEIVATSIASAAVIGNLIFVAYYLRKKYFEVNEEEEDSDTQEDVSNDEDEERNKLDEDDAQESKVDEELELRKPSKIWNTAILFPDMEISIRKPMIGRKNNLNLNSYEEFDVLSPYEKISYYLENATSSIYLCFLMFSERNLATKINEFFRRGGLVRVITDFDTFNEPIINSSARFFMKQGIEVRTKNTGSLMHNKFIIIDEEAVLTGSLNFTKRAMLEGGHENVVVTTNSTIAGMYVKEFEKMWNEIGPVKVKHFRNRN